MNQNIWEGISPEPQSCPLVHLGHNSLRTDKSSQEQFFDGNSDHQPEALDMSILSLGSPDWRCNDENFNKINGKQPANFLLQNFSKLKKPSLVVDQGYHTLGFSNQNLMADTNIWGALMKGKRKINSQRNCFDQLPDCLVVRIFSYLSNIELVASVPAVCQRFYILAWSPILWRIVRLEGGHINGDQALRCILKKLCDQNDVCTSIERIYMSYGVKITDKSLLLLARHCTELTHLQTLGSHSVTNNAVCDMVSRCTKLQHLDVTGCVKISCISINPGFSNYRWLNLQYLDLTDCVALQDSSLRVVVSNCPQLTHLYLRRCSQITDAGLKFVPSFCPDLKELSVSDCTNITDFGLYELGKLGSVLRYLSVAKCHQVSDAGIKVIARRCYKLRYLNARGCEAVSDDAIIVLARFCTRLSALDVGKCDVSDTGVRALAESCPNLKKLSLRSCDLVTDRGVQYIAYYCRGLQQLNIQDCQISLEGYRAVKKYCRRCVIEHTNPGFF